METNEKETNFPDQNKKFDMEQSFKDKWYNLRKAEDSIVYNQDTLIFTNLKASTICK